MRRKQNRDGFINWSGRIPTADRDHLRALTSGFNGGLTWSIVESLRAFVLIMQDSPMLRVWAHDDIALALETPPEYPVCEVSFEVPAALYEAFNELFPEFGAAVWFQRRAVKAMIRELEAEPLSLKPTRAVNLYFCPGT